MICSIHQPQCLPWLGYFDKIRSSDTFVFLDDVQFKKNEYQNRNRIRVNDEARWLTVPVSFNFGDTLRETSVVNSGNWQKKMIKTLELNYSKAAFFKQYSPALFETLEREWQNIAELNEAIVKKLMDCFDITTETVTSSDLPEFSSDPTGRLIDICRHLGADTYLSGAGGRDYLDIEAFSNAGMKLLFQEFLHPEYPQCYTSNNEFVSHLSAIDMLFNCGSGYFKNTQ